MKRSWNLMFIFLLLLSLNTYANNEDPYEKINRPIFAFNDTVDHYVLKPAAKLYNIIIPKPLTLGIANIFNNIATLPTIANDILQFHFYQMANDSWRFAINSTIGVLGLFDVAERMQLKPYTNDFGLTLANWGYTNSAYLVVPLWGNTTIRDGIGAPVDYYAFSPYPYIYPDATRYSIEGVGVISRRAQALKFENVLDEASFDKYTFLRTVYLQRRLVQIEENKRLGYYSKQKKE